MSPTKRKEFSSIIIIVLVIIVNASEQVKLPGPLVYVVTPSSPQQNVQIDSAPRRGAYYYNSWRRNMDTTESSTTITQKNNVKTPDLIFAEFESDNAKDPNNMKKSIRKLLENERIKSSTPTTTTKRNDLIFAEFESEKQHEGGVQKSIMNLLKKERVNENTDSMIMSLPTFSNMHDVKKNNEIQSNYSNTPNSEETYNNVHANYNDAYEGNLNKATSSLNTDIISSLPNEDITPAPMKLEDIWHVINNEQINEGAGKWDEVQINVEPTVPAHEITVDDNTADDNDATITEPTVRDPFKDNFVYPGFNSHNENTSENESRAIRTESNLRFPYVNLKTFQMKNKPAFNQKKGNNMYISVDNFKEEENPLRGEAQDSVLQQRVQIDRYNPAKPYLPSSYGSVKKQTASLQPAPAPVNNVANLIPPPPPPQPSRPSSDDFPPPPDTYESFPPYPPAPPAPAMPPSRPMAAYRPPLLPSVDISNSDPTNDNTDASGPPNAMGGGYKYKPPTSNEGFDYNPPTSGGGGYDYKPPIFPLAPPADDDTSPPPDYSGPSSEDSKPQISGYSYKKPTAIFHGHGHADESDYPELIFGKPQMNTMQGNGGMDGMMKGVEMMPPPPPPAGDSGMDDSKPDFPNLSFAHHPHDDDYKYHHHHDYDDFEHYHHHHHTTTTTTTTEMPRVNRFSYYYLGKKLYYLPLYFSVYFVVYVASLIIKAILRHKIVYPNSWKPYTAKRSVDNLVQSGEKIHEITRIVTNGLMKAAERYTSKRE